MNFPTRSFQVTVPRNVQLPPGFSGLYVIFKISYLCSFRFPLFCNVFSSHFSRLFCYKVVISDYTGTSMAGQSTIFCDRKEFRPSTGVCFLRDEKAVKKYSCSTGSSVDSCRVRSRTREVLSSGTCCLWGRAACIHIPAFPLTHFSYHQKSLTLLVPRLPHRYSEVIVEPIS